MVSSVTPRASEIFAMVLNVKLCVPPSHRETSASVLPILFGQLLLTDILFPKNHVNLIGKGKRHIKFHLDVVLNGGKTFIK